jgi:deoxyribonuclease V
MPLARKHSWSVDPSTAQRIQLALAGEVRIEDFKPTPRTVAGADVSLTPDRKNLIGGFVVCRWDDLTPLTSAVWLQPATFPYIPGLLSFREIPVLLEAWWMLEIIPDLIFCDGQGIAHPRAFGLASHLGLLLRTPTIGCAKKRLVGTHQEVESAKGSWKSLVLGDKVIGCALRTRDNTKPVFVSPGHLVGFDQARNYVLAACPKFRIPEPIRAAHRLVNAHRIQLPP